MSDVENESAGYGRILGWTAGTAVVLLTLYVLSSGPTAALASRYDEHGDWWDTVYAPLLRLGNTPNGGPLEDYIGWWMPRDNFLEWRWSKLRRDLQEFRLRRSSP